MERGAVGPLTEDDRAAILAENDDMGAAGLLVLGMAFAERPAAEADHQPRSAGSGWSDSPIRFDRTCGS